MKSKLVSFPAGHFATKKRSPLTPLMVVALIEAYAKQRKNIPFGPKDVNGSFMPLITRGLIIKRDTAIHEETKSSWQVTPEAIDLLKKGNEF